MTRKEPQCDLYVPGHMVHWIQARRASEHPHTWGVLDGVSGQVITVRFLDRVVRYRNHQAVAVLDVAQAGAKVHVSERYGLLGIPLENRDVGLFCIVDADEPWRPCSVAPAGPVSFEDLADRVNDRGGFSVPAAFLPGMDPADNVS
jgi:hypothetical protein